MGHRLDQIIVEAPGFQDQVHLARPIGASGEGQDQVTQTIGHVVSIHIQRVNM